MLLQTLQARMVTAHVHWGATCPDIALVPSSIRLAIKQTSNETGQAASKQSQSARLHASLRGVYICLGIGGGVVGMVWDTHFPFPVHPT
jgi:hypothetical protein